MDGRLAGKSILVTGAGGAIGGATARRLASEDATVILADRPEASLDAVGDSIASAGGITPLICRYDAASPQSSAALVAGAVEQAGRLDAVCNIAGIYAKTHSTDLTDDQWQHILQVNLSSVFTISREAIPHLIRTGGSVVSTSSLAALEGLAYSIAYAVAKAGVTTLMKSLAAEFAASGVRFNAICPGAIRSSMSSVTAVRDADPDLAFRRSKLKGFDNGYGEPEDAAAAFAYLVSDDARFVSGTELVIDGGQFLL